MIWEEVMCQDMFYKNQGVRLTWLAQSFQDIYFVYQAR